MADKATQAELSALNRKLTILDRLLNNLNELASQSIIAIPEKSISVSWNPSDWEIGSLATASGANFGSTIRIRSADFLKAEPNTKYAVFLVTTDDNDIANESMINIFEYKSDNTFIKTTGVIANQSVFTTSPDTAIIKILLRNLKDNVDITTDYVTVAKPVISKVY